MRFGVESVTFKFPQLNLRRGGELRVFQIHKIQAIFKSRFFALYFFTDVPGI